MNENITIILKRVDTLIEQCKQQTSYNQVYNEIKPLILSILGENSQEYQTLLKAHVNYWFQFNKFNTYIGLLNSLKNHIIIHGLETNKKGLDLTPTLHHLVYKVSYNKFLDGYYSDAVETAIKEINTRLKNLYKKYKNKELDGADLFAMVFNSDKEKTLLIAGDDLISQSGKDEQEGYRLLFMGLWKGIRNPKAHANTSLNKEECVDRLLFTSMLMNKIDECIKKANLIE